MRTRRLFALTLALTGVAASVSSSGCSSAPSENDGDAQSELTDNDDGDEDGGEAATEEEMMSVDPEDDSDADPEICTAAGDQDPSALEMYNHANDQGVGAGASALNTPADDDDDDAADDVDGLPGEPDGAFASMSTAEMLTAAKIPSKIKYILVLVKENHTFDNYFTGFPGASSSSTARLRPTKKFPHGRVIHRMTAPDGAIGGTPCHSNHCGNVAYRNGGMDGFDEETDPTTPFLRYRENQIPNYWKYAREYVLADHMFSTSLAPSAPGHEVFWFGRSTTIDNPKCNLPGGKGCAGTGCTADKHVTATAFNPLTCNTKKVRPCFNLPSLPDHLPHGFNWMDYGGPMAMQIKSVADSPHPEKHFASSHQLLKDLKAGTIANLTIAHLSGGAISEHPPEGPCEGENFSTEVISAAMALPQWKEMAIVVTWDDWGGFYDHVKPRVHTCKNGKVMENGFRLPLILISPYAKKGHVLKTHTEQASVPKLVEELWGMKFMSTRNKHARDGVAGSLMGAFDFNQPPRAPLVLKPRATCPK